MAAVLDWRIERGERTEPMQDRNFYKVLQVDPAAEIDVIAAAYKSLAGRLHPDTDASGVDAIRLQELNQAYTTLRDLAQRQAYDESLAREAAARRVAMGPGHRAVGGGGITGRIERTETDGLRAMRIDFGRYQGWTLGELLRADRDYLRWLMRHSSGIRYRSAIMRLLGEHETRVGPR